MHLLKFIWFIQFCLTFVKSEEVQAILYPYNYTGTNCTAGLMVNMPVYLEGFVRFPGSINDADIYIFLEWNGSNQTKFRQFQVILNKCDASAFFLCKPLPNTLGYGVYLHTEAKIYFSNSKWRLRLTHKGIHVFSNVINLPKIYSATGALMTLNEQIWSQENRLLAVSTEYLKICCNDTPSPCEAVISIKSKPHVTDYPCVTHTLETHVKGKIEEIKFGFRVCGIDNFSLIYTTGFILVPPRGPENVSYYSTVILPSISGVLLMFVIAIFFKIYRKADCCEKKKKASNNQTVRYIKFNREHLLEPEENSECSIEENKRPTLATIRGRRHTEPDKLSTSDSWSSYTHRKQDCVQIEFTNSSRTETRCVSENQRFL